MLLIIKSSVMPISSNKAMLFILRCSLDALLISHSTFNKLLSSIENYTKSILGHTHVIINLLKFINNYRVLNKGVRKC